MSEKGEKSPQQQPSSSYTERDVVPDDNDGLPGYSEASQQPRLYTSAGSRPINTAFAMPELDISQYLSPGAVASKDGSTVTIQNANLCSDPDALVRFINTQAALPPRPEIRISGTHNSYGENKTDFDIRVNLVRCLVRKPTDAPLNYIKMVEPKELAFRGDSTKSTQPHADGGLNDWAGMFCRDASTEKSFVLEREVPNWNTPLLEGRIRNLLASMKYRGNVSVSFPMSHTTVVVTPASPGGFVTKLFSKLSEARKSYGVVRAIWPYASMPSSSLASAMEGQGGPRRVCAVQSEEEWWDVWSSVLGEAILEKRRGWVTVDDLLEEAMTGKKPAKAAKEWGGNSW